MIKHEENKTFFDFSLNGKADNTTEELSLVKMMKENRQTLLKLVSTLIVCFEKSWQNIIQAQTALFFQVRMTLLGIQF